MTQSAPIQQSEDVSRANARMYVRSLVAGVKPLVRPEFGSYTRGIREIEAAFTEIKPGEHATMLPKSIKTIGNMRAYKPLRLLQLLTEKETEQGEIEQKKSMPELPEQARRSVGLLPKVSPWLRGYMEYSKQFSPEGFKDFHLGCGLWLLSTVAARRLRVPLSDPIITPLSIVMCARTSLFAKTTTARAARKVIKEAGLDLRLGDDETTPQRLLFDMAGHVPTNYGEMEEEDKEEIRYKLAMSGQLGWYYDEFGQLVDSLKRQGPMAEFAGLLRKLDNCEETYRYSTKSGGQDKITNPYLALLASTTPADLASHASKNNRMWSDGFWARMLFCCPNPNDFITATMKKGIVSPPAEIVQALKAWNQRLGIPLCSVSEKTNAKGEGTGHFTAEVEELPISDIDLQDGVEEAWACYREALRSLVASNSLQDLDGSYSRLPTLAMRIAALIASLENNNYLTLDIWSLAQEIAELFRANLHRLYEQISIPMEGNSTEDVLLDFLKTKPEGTTARDIVQRGPAELRRLKTDGVRSMLMGLRKDGLVDVVKQGRKECWMLTPATAESSG